MQNANIILSQNCNLSIYVFYKICSGILIICYTKGEAIVKNRKTYYKVTNYDYVYRGMFSYRLFLFTDRSFLFVVFFAKAYLQSEC